MTTTRNSHRAQAPRRKQSFQNQRLYSNLTIFYSAENLRQKEAAAQALIDSGGSEGLLLGAAALLETACLVAPPKSTRQLELFARAGLTAKRLQLANPVSESLGRHAISAMQLLTNIPLLVPIYSEGEMPSEKIISKHYKTSLIIAKEAKNGKYVSKTESNSVRNTERFGGLLGELTVGLLLERYGIHAIGNNTWVPVTSHLSEDRQCNDVKTSNRTTWDLTVFTKPFIGEPIERPYKVQVKAGLPREHENYMPDIAVIRREDIALEGEHQPNYSRVINELIAEYEQPSAALSTSLDLRCETLVNNLV